jgi:hypothetical protein
VGVGAREIVTFIGEDQLLVAPCASCTCTLT